MTARTIAILSFVAAVAGCTSDEPPPQCTIDHCHVDRAAGTACCPSKPTDGKPACCEGPQMQLVRRACHPTTRQCFMFCTGCVPHGWMEPVDHDSGKGPDAASIDTVKGCKPSFSITKASCPWSLSSTQKLCPAGQLCEDYRRCVKVGCNTGPDCHGRLWSVGELCAAEGVTGQCDPGGLSRGSRACPAARPRSPISQRRVQQRRQRCLHAPAAAPSPSCSACRPRRQHGRLPRWRPEAKAPRAWLRS